MGDSKFLLYFNNVKHDSTGLDAFVRGREGDKTD